MNFNIASLQIPYINMYPGQLIAHICIVVILVALSVLSKKITVRGALLGGFITFLLWSAFGLIGLATIVVFFIFGTAASIWKKNEKKKYKLEQQNEGKRDYHNVVGNGGVAGLLSLLTFYYKEPTLLLTLMAIASFAAALSDTFSSEFGNIYGRKFINVLTLKTGSRGQDGVISLEGSVFGFIGSLLIAMIFYLFYRKFSLATIILLSGISGNFIDSILGTSLQKRGWLNNHSVNFLSIMLASLFALLLYYLFTK
ncbi:uncharacterized protein (TIGR00297 family) [Catalinimonas alkaloidigena]|uniref:DUF92 domain-containing protein n=1 Tax=Catalinimonas alkaloidigena TaxID=1075417 RepID=UPI002406A257|nr:DUF92 domain-containing protein [Catalinimonas alkaloidigena]MDF9797007.1 uncharacterized protein (TIGR00297 family) [Catalinimonas alkaloidigena]